MDECFLSTQEFADMCGVTPRTVTRWIEQGLIFAVKIGRSFQIPCDEQNPRELDQPEPEPEPGVDFTDDVEIIIGDEFPEEGLEDDDAPCADPYDFPSQRVRQARLLTSLDDANSYAEEIAVPTSVWKNCSTGFYFVVVEYP